MRSNTSPDACPTGPSPRSISSAFASEPVDPAGRPRHAAEVTKIKKLLGPLKIAAGRPGGPDADREARDPARRSLQKARSQRSEVRHGAANREKQTTRTRLGQGEVLSGFGTESGPDPHPRLGARLEPIPVAVVANLGIAAAARADRSCFPGRRRSVRTYSSWQAPRQSIVELESVRNRGRTAAASAGSRGRERKIP